MPQKSNNCIFKQCGRPATCVPILVFPRGNSTQSEPNRAKIQQPMCDSCRLLVDVKTFLTPSAIEYYRAVYAKNGIEFPSVSAITLEWEPYHPKITHGHQC